MLETWAHCLFKLWRLDFGFGEEVEEGGGGVANDMPPTQQPCHQLQMYLNSRPAKKETFFPFRTFGFGLALIVIIR